MYGHFWFHGPSWLTEPADSWPNWKLPSTLEMSSSDDDEPETTCLAAVLETPDIQRIIALESYSTLRRLLRVTAFVERFIRNCRDTFARTVGSLLPIELASARTRWIHATQHHRYATEITCYSAQAEGRGPSLKMQLFFFFFF